jgi:hypothetical protein
MSGSANGNLRSALIQLLAEFSRHALASVLDADLSARGCGRPARARDLDAVALSAVALCWAKRQIFVTEQPGRPPYSVVTERNMEVLRPSACGQGGTRACSKISTVSGSAPNSFRRPKRSIRTDCSTIRPSAPREMRIRSRLLRGQSPFGGHLAVPERDVDHLRSLMRTPYETENRRLSASTISLRQSHRRSGWTGFARSTARGACGDRSDRSARGSL